MKLDQIIEARYYGKHTVEQVFARLANMAGTVFKNVTIERPTIPLSYENALIARIYAYDVDDEQQAINHAQSILQKYGVPFTDIGNAIDYGNRTIRVTMSYDPDNLTEARYYRRPSLEQIDKRLKELSYETMKKDVYISDGAVVNGKVHADFYVYGIENEDDVVKAIEQFLSKQGIPYTRIWNVINTTYRDTGYVYQATMTYDPKQIADRDLQ